MLGIVFHLSGLIAERHNYLIINILNVKIITVINHNYSLTVDKTVLQHCHVDATFTFRLRGLSR